MRDVHVSSKFKGSFLLTMSKEIMNKYGKTKEEKEKEKDKEIMVARR